MFRLFAAFLIALPLAAGEPLPIEDMHFFPESGWNRTDGVWQYNAFVYGRAHAHELTQEWASRNARHQLSFTVPVYAAHSTGLGDTTVNYRRQLVGSSTSRVAVAPRVSLLLPTRSAPFGARASGVQVNVPLSAAITSRLTLHSSAGATWYRGGAKEINLAQSVGVAVTDRLTLSLDGAWTRCDEADHLLIVRPGLQYAFDAPGGLRLAPGIALPLGPDRRQLLVFLSVERRIVGQN